MKRCSRSRRSFCLALETAVIASALSIVVWSISTEYRQSARVANDAVARGRLAQLKLCIDNYKTLHGVTLPRISTNALGAPISWREVLSAFFDDKTVRGLATHPDRKDESRRGSEGLNAPMQLRLPFDPSDRQFTSIVAVYDETDQDANDAPWAIIAMVNTGLRWNEPKDLTVSEFETVLKNPSSTIQPIAVLAASGHLGNIDDPSSIRFFINSPGYTSIKSLLVVPRR